MTKILLKTIPIATIDYDTEVIEEIGQFPEDIKERKDLRMMDRSRQSQRKVNELYGNIKKLLINLDEEVKEFTDNLDKNWKWLSEHSNEMKEDFIELRESHTILKNRIALSNAMALIEDDFLIASILHHIKLTDFWYTIVDENIFDNIKNTRKKDLDKIKENVELLKAVTFIYLQPLFVYGAIVASIKRDYEYIIKYEKAVQNSSRSIFKTDPTIYSILKS